MILPYWVYLHVFRLNRYIYGKLLFFELSSNLYFYLVPVRMSFSRVLIRSKNIVLVAAAAMRDATRNLSQEL